ncbi:MAG TPA: tetratricopeptide repeat protein [Bryobacteraceae bacterium]|nr:tetratricopeptide repeat protein [Bryobacteraceae bacterium]
MGRKEKQASPSPLGPSKSASEKSKRKRGSAPVPLSKLEQQAQAGDGAAACILGDHYRTGDVVSQDWGTAFRWYSRGAALGDRDAQNNLGTMFLGGIGCEPDKAQAVHWYRKSAEQGKADAQWNLGKRYLHGDGVDQDYAEAYQWFSKAAVQGYTGASCEIGTMHWLGHGVERNALAAADFHLIAAEAGDDVACRNLSEYKAELEDMALFGSQMASLFLSRMHNRGFGAQKSQPLTWGWISWAKKRCLDDTDIEIAEEVSAAYHFHHMCITSENRKHGEKLLADLRAVHKKRAKECGKAQKHGTRRDHSEERT